MAIDYVIDWQCIPKETFGTAGILERLKEHERANAVIKLFRQNGDNRPPSEMGFEFTRSTPDDSGDEETQVIVVQDLLDNAAELDPLAHHCESCPANRTGTPFGCIGFIQYPLSAMGEAWLLNLLPTPDEALIWLLLKQGIEEFQYDGSTVLPLRQAGGAYFEQGGLMSRRLGEFAITSDQVFEMLFLLGDIQPTHAGILLLFFGATSGDLNAEAIMKLTPPGPNAFVKHPFLMRPEEHDDRTISDMKSFFAALYLAWTLNVKLLLDV
ncbi:MAG: hypothetical protein H7175_19660 [Burkholderiales bacterium]|nr:hypothetical protein [Anaerolineae bacterium]